MKPHTPDRRLADRMKNSILCALYALPTRKRIQRDIMEALGIHLHEVQLYAYRKQLVAEELIREYEDGTTDCEVEITLKGYEAIQLFGTYQDYCREKKKQAQAGLQRHCIEAWDGLDEKRNCTPLKGWIGEG